MTFLIALFQTVFKMIVIAAVAFGGILLGKYLRKKKEEKDAVFMHLEAVTDKVRSDPEEFRSYLDAQARLARYSVSNVLLINEIIRFA